MVSSIERKSQKIDSHAKHPTLVDYNNAPTPEATRGKNIYRKTDGRSSIYPSSNDLISIVITVLGLKSRSIL